MMKLALAAVLLAAAAPVPVRAFSLESLDLAGVRAAAVEAPAASPAGVAVEPRPLKRFTIRIARACDAGPFILASWCPETGADVKGGLERELVVKAGDDVELRLVNTGGIPDASLGIGGHSFELPEFGVSALTPLGAETTVRFTAARAGRYKYYDALWLNGYGVLVVLP
jgi:hypothetical protein